MLIIGAIKLALFVLFFRNKIFKLNKENEIDLIDHLEKNTVYKPIKSSNKNNKNINYQKKGKYKI